VGPAIVGEGIVGPKIVGPARVGPAIVGPARVGPAIVGEGIVGEGIVGPKIVGPRIVGPAVVGSGNPTSSPAAQPATARTAPAPARTAPTAAQPNLIEQAGTVINNGWNGFRDNVLNPIGDTVSGIAATTVTTVRPMPGMEESLKEVRFGNGAWAVYDLNGNLVDAPTGFTGPQSIPAWRVRMDTPAGMGFPGMAPGGVTAPGGVPAPVMIPIR
jgi:hypothetical protein